MSTKEAQGFYQVVKDYLLKDNSSFNSKTCDQRFLQAFESIAKYTIERLFQDQFKPTISLEAFISDLSTHKTKKTFEDLRSLVKLENASEESICLLEILQRIDNLARLNRTNNVRCTSNLYPIDFSRNFILAVIKDLNDASFDKSVVLNQSCNYLIPCNITLSTFATYAVNIFVFLMVQRIVRFCYGPSVLGLVTIASNDVHLKHILSGLRFYHHTDSKHLS